ncbi:hypothetical protein EXIGLDRAFT_390983 [Exidia glandulosa HHB12029]|uniref:Uncharacterized protein n=1 Tax=Exidia glandulosa HHB12029 TaxID=1314781 RepID=A0A165L027_EXIGL|nr:hypothetical protein EXIGLDRAFT_390983 [Exidia glandulosa HHB12029]
MSFPHSRICDNYSGVQGRTPTPRALPSKRILRPAFEKIVSSHNVQLSGLLASNLVSGTPPSHASSRELRRWSRTRSPTELDPPTSFDIPPPRIPHSSLSTRLVPAPSVELPQGLKCSFVVGKQMDMKLQDYWSSARPEVIT